MESGKLMNELLFSLQLQKEYIGLEIEEKILQLYSIIALVLAFLITGTVLMYFWGGIIASLGFLVVFLLATASFTCIRKHTITRTKRNKKTEMEASQTSLKSHFKEMATPTDAALQLCQTIRTFADIIREVKQLFKSE